MVDWYLIFARMLVFNIWCCQCLHFCQSALLGTVNHTVFLSWRWDVCSNPCRGAMEDVYLHICISFSVSVCTLCAMTLALGWLSIAKHPTALHCSALPCTANTCTALHWTALHCTTLHYTELHYNALNCTTLHYSALHYTALYCFTALPRTIWLKDLGLRS